MPITESYRKEQADRPCSSHLKTETAAYYQQQLAHAEQQMAWSAGRTMVMDEEARHEHGHERMGGVAQIRQATGYESSREGVTAAF